jgi:hypothetical protein
MENLQQIVVQITNSPDVRAIVQYGEGFLPDSQILVNYEELTKEEQRVWSQFVTMLSEK